MTYNRSAISLMVWVSLASHYQYAAADNNAPILTTLPSQTPPAAVLVAKMSSPNLSPTLVGVFVNGQEQDSFDVIYDTDADYNNTDTVNDHYYLAIDNLSQLTAIRVLSQPAKPAVNSPDTVDSGANSNDAKTTQGTAYYQDSVRYQNTVRYIVNTPIGDTQLTAAQVTTYQGRDYVALSTLKQLGITAEYSQPDLAIYLNMGWQPERINNKVDSDSAAKLPIDYYPSRAGLLKLSFDSSINVIETHDTGEDANNSSPDSYGRQLYANMGAFGYGLGGVWGVSASGSDNDVNNGADSNRDRDHAKTNRGGQNLSQMTWDGLTQLPWDWQDWQIDNLYWAKSGKHMATRLGVNQPNALGQGAQVTGSQFTGALLAYSNRDIHRHLSQFDENSSSLLQNTNEDLQHITGIGEAGGVAELRINGRSLARVQIGLDGRYQFLNLDINRLRLSDTLVEIAIYAYPLARQPLEVRTIALGKRRTNVATDELLIEAGLGRSGNLINTASSDRSSNKSDTIAHVYSEYGLNNQLAIRGGALYRSNNHTVNNKQDRDSDSADVSWFVGANFSPDIFATKASQGNAVSNADISYAHSPNQDLWQAQFDYRRESLWANYRYQWRDYPNQNRNQNQDQAQKQNQDRAQNQDQDNQKRPSEPATRALLNADDTMNERVREQRHQLLLSYRPNNRTSIGFNQYYNHFSAPDYLLSNKNSDRSGYHSYTSINHRFNEALSAGINWNSQDDRYSYRLLWQDHSGYRDKTNNTDNPQAGSRNSIGLTGDNDSDTLSLRHQLNHQTSFGQSISHLHGQDDLLYQGDVSHRFDPFWVDADARMGARPADSLLTLGYSLYGGQFGWQADWQLTRHNGLSLSVGYDHRYVSSVPIVFDHHGQSSDFRQPWARDSQLYARLSFDMYKAPRQPLQVGQYPLSRQGSVIVDIQHPPEPAIDTDSLSFRLNNQKIQANLLGHQSTSSQFLLSGIKPGDFTLTMDSESLPLEFSTAQVPTPRVRVSSYAPTLVPLVLQKTYGLSGKLADAKEGVVIAIYQDAEQIQTVTTGQFGYFQIFGLTPNKGYDLKAQGYEPKQVNIKDDFVMNITLDPY